MYVAPVFKADADKAWSFVTSRGFGTVILTEGGRPVASHLPFVAERTGDGARLELHVARANRLHEIAGTGAPVLVVVAGPDAYVSPDWYVSADQVPTWNYVSVHISGTARVLPSDKALAHVDRLSAAFEERLAPKRPWTSGKMPAAKREAMLKAIVPMEIIIESAEAQWKLAQHKTFADRVEVARMLAWRGDWSSLAVSELMSETLAPRRGDAKVAA